MILVATVDANRGVSFAGKYFPQDPEIGITLEQIKKRKPELEIVQYEEFNGDWTTVNYVILFNKNLLQDFTTGFRPGAGLMLEVSR